jgi:hypothetical protein
MKKLALDLMTIGFVRIQKDVLSLITWNDISDVKEYLSEGMFKIVDTHILSNGSNQYDITFV